VSRTRPRSLRPPLVLLLALVAALVLGPAGPASAHATLVASDPAEGAVLETAPDLVSLTFSEAVTEVPDGVAVFDAEGRQVAAEATVDGARLGVGLTEEVGAGTLVVVWRVLSEDGHPVGGSLSFSVGAPSAEVVPPPDVPTGEPAVPPALSTVRVVGYVALLLAAGLVGFALLVLPAGSPAAQGRRRLVRTARVAAAVAALAWLAAVPLSAVYQLGGGAGSLADGATWSALPLSEYAVLVAVAIGAPLAAGLLGDGSPGRARAAVALVAAAAAVGAPALTGHTRAASPEALAVAADVVHLLAGSVWLGGLVALALVLPELAGRGEEGAEVLARFSGAAAGVLAALVATGTVLAWRILGSWSGLVETSYGQLLLAKIAAALVVVALAAWNRFGLLPLLRRAARRRDRRAAARQVVGTTVAEASVLVVVLLLTGVLVDRSPEETTDDTAPAWATGTGVHTATLGDIEVTATIAPHTTGPNTLTLELRDADGAPTEGLEAPRARLSTPEVDLGTIPLEAALAGTYTAQVVLPTAGTWELQVSLRTSEFDNPVATLQFPVFDPVPTAG
jgi:copper transport protein